MRFNPLRRGAYFSQPVFRTCPSLRLIISHVISVMLAKIAKNTPHRNEIANPTSEFLPEHPGGDRILKRFAGKNATKAFWKYHSENVLKKYGDKYKIGTVAEAPKL